MIKAIAILWILGQAVLLFVMALLCHYLIGFSMMSLEQTVETLAVRDILKFEEAQQVYLNDHPHPSIERVEHPGLMAYNMFGGQGMARMSWAFLFAALVNLVMSCGVCFVIAFIPCGTETKASSSTG